MIKRNLLPSEKGSGLKGKIRVDPVSQRRIKLRPCFSEGIEACAALRTSLLCMNRLDKKRPFNLCSIVSRCFQKRPFRFIFYFIADGIKCRLMDVKRSPVGRKPRLT